MKDRRSAERIATNLTAKWGGLAGDHEGRIESLSLRGCFVNTTGRVDVGEIVGVEIRLPSGEWLQLRGEDCFLPGRYRLWTPVQLSHRG